jgi:hypothetical protein
MHLDAMQTRNVPIPVHGDQPGTNPARYPHLAIGVPSADHPVRRAAKGAPGEDEGNGEDEQENRAALAGLAAEPFVPGGQALARGG